MARVRTHRKRYRSKRKTSKSIRREVNRVINKKIELKVRQYTYDSVGKDVTGTSAQSFGSVSYGSTSIVAGLAVGIANGTGEGQRIGNNLTLKGVQVNFAIQPGDNTNYFRLMLVSPKKRYDILTTAGFVQDLLSGTASAATQWLAPIDTDNFSVLFNKRFFLKYSPLDGSSATTIYNPKFIKQVC